MPTLLRKETQMKASRNKLFLLVAFFFIMSTGLRAQDLSFYVHDGDRIVFYGDSITEQDLYTALVETYIFTRFPRLNVSFINSGWGGDWVEGGGGGGIEDRLRRDVFAYRPTVMTVMFGMNDACYSEFIPKCFEVFKEGYERLLGLMKTELPQLRLTLLQPSPFDDFTGSSAWRMPPPITGGYNNVLVRYGQFVKQLAGTQRLIAADLNESVVSVLRKAQAVDPNIAQKIIPDRIHPALAGHLLMAEALLKAWNAPALVTSVELDAARKRIEHVANTDITELKISDNLSWIQDDKALPLPLDTSDPVLALVLSLSDVLTNLDEQTLKVTNLRAARYKLKIDDFELGAWTNEQLAQGINLATLPTPMLKQSLGVFSLTLQHHRIHYVRWRELQVPLYKMNLAGTTKTLDDLDALEIELIKRQRVTAITQPHRYELIPEY
jgi:lysophospholipase L1-like esterase